MRDVPDEQRAIVELHIDELERTSEQLANIDKGSISESYLGSIPGSRDRAGLHRLLLSEVSMPRFRPARAQSVDVG
jgi:hypothetical protein